MKIDPYSIIYIYTLKHLLLSTLAYKPVSIFSLLLLSIMHMFICLPAYCVHIILNCPYL